MNKKILEYLDIDTRLKLGVPPGRLTHIPNLDIPTKRLFIKDGIVIKVSPWRMWFYYTVFTRVSNTNYTAETEYCYETGRVVTRVTGGSSQFRLYQIVDDPADEEELFMNNALRDIHAEFDRLRLLLKSSVED